MFQRFRRTPGFSSRFARLGQSMEAPKLIPVLKLESTDPAPPAPIGACGPIDDDIIDDHRGHAEIMALLGACDLPLPEKFAVGHIEGDEKAVRGTAHDAPILDGDASVGIGQSLAFQLPVVAPDLPAIGGVDGGGRLSDRKEDAAFIENRRRLGRRRDTAIEGANPFEASHIARSYLVESDVAVAVIALIGHEPAVDGVSRKIEFVLAWTRAKSRDAYTQSQADHKNSRDAG